MVYRGIYSLNFGFFPRPLRGVVAWEFSKFLLGLCPAGGIVARKGIFKMNPLIIPLGILFLIFLVGSVRYYRDSQEAMKGLHDEASQVFGYRSPNVENVGKLIGK